VLRCHHGQPRPTAAHSPWLVRRREPPLVRPRFSEIATRRTNISMKNEVRRAGRKPNSVAPPCGRACGHLSGSLRCRATPRGQPGAYPLSEIGAGRSVAPYSALLPVGFAVPRVSPRERCALTAPFHPCLIPPSHEAPAGHRRSVLCGTFPGLAAGGRYPPPCPAEFGLSSRSSRIERPHHPLAGLHLVLYHGAAARGYLGFSGNMPRLAVCSLTKSSIALSALTSTSSGTKSSSSPMLSPT